MADRLNSFLPRIAVLVLGVLSLTAGLTYAAGSNVSSAPPPAVTVQKPVPVTVPDVRNQAFVFAKGTLEDAGFAWQVVGSVQGYPANLVVAQSPAPGTRLVQTGAPLITLTLKQASGYAATGDPENASPYQATAVQPMNLADESRLGPANPAKVKTPAPAATTTTSTTRATTTPAATTTTTASTTTPALTTTTAPATTTTGNYPVKHAALYPQNRPPAFTVPGGRKEPLDEMPLTERATQLGTWLEKHQTKSAANAKYWLYQNEWIVTGAQLGWWHGAQALQTLIQVDGRTQQLWGIGAKSQAEAESALADVRAKSGD